MNAKEMRIAEKLRRTPGNPAKRQPLPENPGAFTLIELLVVISILTLLMAILLPTLQQVRKQAKGAACQAKLRQWGFAFSMYMDDHNDQFYNDEAHDTVGQWWQCARPYYGDLDALFLCPMASRWEVNKNAPNWDENWEAVGFAWGSKFAAWRFNREFWNVERKTPLSGSYGWNDLVPMTYCARPGAGLRPPPARSQMPFLLDCVNRHGYGTLFDQPPAYDGDLSLGPNGVMKWFCIDRHKGGINSLFMDWSVRKTGLKELWTLKWVKGYDSCGPWTKAGGVKPDDWPEWMRRFKDY
jgi:prepilin-type N-terminal cleavage/methylation domain-containing protein/prepilin-type processing-associated H-X9-DG protein